MNRSTSRPSSRKYSAKVRPVSATRRRAPGGSFIWPNAITVLLDDARLGHLVEQVVALAGALAHAREHGVAAVLLGDVADELLDDDRLAHAGAAEDADLAALGEGCDEVDDLDAGLEDLDRGGLVLERRRLTVDGIADLGLDRALAVDGLAQDVEHATQGRRAPRAREMGAAGVDGLEAAGEAVGGGHGHRAHPVVAQVLLHLAGHGATRSLDADRVEDGRQLRRRELDVHDRSGDGDDAPGGRRRRVRGASGDSHVGGSSDEGRASGCSWRRWRSRSSRG